MANLIITVIAIALVAVASLMGAYYGGQAFTEGRDQANAATVLNQGQQLAAAFRMAEAQGDDLAAQDALYTGDFLSQPSPPEVGNVTPDDWTFLASADDLVPGTALTSIAGAQAVMTRYPGAPADGAIRDTCHEFNKASGVGGADGDTDISGATDTPETTAAGIEATDRAFCYESTLTGEEGTYFVFKL